MILFDRNGVKLEIIGGCFGGKKRCVEDCFWDIACFKVYREEMGCRKHATL
jgi:hypothetical protein